MRLALPIAILALLCACGTVENEAVDAASVVDSSPADSSPADAEVIDAIESDARVCDGNTVDACGPQCRMCVVNNDRQVPTCDGSSCGIACRSGLSCSDSTCSRLVWDFEDRTTGGLVARTANTRLDARNFNGANTLGVEVALGDSVAEVAVEIPICNSGTVSLRARTVKYRVFYDAGADTIGQFYTQVAIPSRQNNALLPGMTVFSGRYNDYSQAASGSQFSDAASVVTILLGTYGQHYTGTIYIDDIRLD